MELEVFELQLRSLVSQIRTSIESVRIVKHSMDGEHFTIEEGVGAVFNMVFKYSRSGDSINDAVKSFVANNQNGIPRNFLGPIHLLVVYLDYLCEHLPITSDGEGFRRRNRYLSLLFAVLHPAAIAMLFLYLHDLDEYAAKIISEEQRDTLYAHNVFRFALGETGLSPNQVNELQLRSIQLMRGSIGYQGYLSTQEAKV